jgi:hypothetical protein
VPLLRLAVGQHGLVYRIDVSASFLLREDTRRRMGSNPIMLAMSNGKQSLFNLPVWGDTEGEYIYDKDGKMLLQTRGWSWIQETKNPMETIRQIQRLTVNAINYYFGSPIEREKRSIQLEDTIAEVAIKLDKMRVASFHSAQGLEEVITELEKALGHPAKFHKSRKV